MNNIEEIFPLKDYDGYGITKSGKVWSYPKNKCKFNNHNGMFINHSFYKDGYVKCKLNDKHVRVHTLVAKTFIPNPNNYKEVNHINGIKNDNRVENLEWCSHYDNMQHAKKKGLMARGERAGSSKLKESEVLEIKYLLTDKNLIQNDIAKIYGVGPMIISNIKNGNRWAWLNFYEYCK